MLPWCAHVTARLLGAVAGVRRALGEPDRPLQHRDQLGRGDGLGIAGERVAALGTALGGEQAVARQRLQNLAHHRSRKLGLRRHLARVAGGLVAVTGQLGHQDDAVVGDAAESEQALSPWTAPESYRTAAVL